jgi:hypothetical protein
MQFLASALVVLAGGTLIFLVDGSVRGIDVDTIGGVLVLVGFVSALLLVLLAATRDERIVRRPEDGEVVEMPRR